MVKALVKPFTSGEEVDFVIDSPQTVSFFAANLIYLGLEHTPLTHVDQVMRSLVVSYKDRAAQGLFKHRWMLFLMKPFVWARMPFEKIGLIQ